MGFRKNKKKSAPEQPNLALPPAPLPPMPGMPLPLPDAASMPPLPTPPTPVVTEPVKIEDSVQRQQAGEEKNCPGCNKLRPLSYFKSSRLISGYGTKCRICVPNRNSHKASNRVDYLYKINKKLY